MRPRPTRSEKKREAVVARGIGAGTWALWGVVALVALGGAIHRCASSDHRAANAGGSDDDDGTRSARGGSLGRERPAGVTRAGDDSEEARGSSAKSPRGSLGHGSLGGEHGGRARGMSDHAVSTSASGSARGGTCSGYDCQVHTCAGGASTSISGTVYDPAGNAPVYDVVAYVPSTAPDPIVPGVACTSCAELYTGVPIASAVTDAAGRFTIHGVPDGSNIPIVLQIGKWRRQLTLSSVPPCVNTAVPDGTLTLPKNGREGDLPNIAVSTGSSDSIECLLSRIGVDRAEYVPGAGVGGHVHIFRGNDGAPDTSPPAPDAYEALWDSYPHVTPYDVVILSCEGWPPMHPNRQLLFDYAAAGGRVLASHSHYVWLDSGPFGRANVATWTSGTHQGGLSLAATIVTTTTAGEPFARGEAFYEWLTNVGALSGGQLPIESPPSYNAIVTSANPVSQPWIVVNKSLGATLAFSFETPIPSGGANSRSVGLPQPGQCGRVVFSDMHVGLLAGDYSGGLGPITPAGCATGDLSPQEKAIEFALFDLSSCVTPGNGPQPPPLN